MEELAPAERRAHAVVKGFSCLVSFAVVAIIFTAVVLLALVLGLTQGLAVICAGGGLVAGAGIAAYLRRSMINTWNWMMRFKVADPTATASNSRKVHVGETLTLSYEQQANRGLKIKKSRAQLIFRETATREIEGMPGMGTQTKEHIHEHIMQDVEQAGDKLAKGENYRFQTSLQIPPDGMHTCLLTYNSLEWLIRVTVTIAGWPNFTEDYPIKVLPEGVKT